MSHTVHLIYGDVLTSLKECQCFVKEGQFKIVLSDIRLQLPKENNCSSAKLQINSAQYLCDDEKDTFGSKFQVDFGEVMTRAFISLTKTSFNGEPRMLWLTVHPQGKTKLCYAFRFITKNLVIIFVNFWSNL